MYNVLHFEFSKYHLFISWNVCRQQQPLQVFFQQRQHVIPQVSFSSCQRNLMKTFQIEAMIALITKMVLIFLWDFLNGQKVPSKSAKIWFSKSIFNIKNPSNLSKKKFRWKISILEQLFCFYQSCVASKLNDFWS